MKKRIVCVLLTLIMLMSLVPMTASAAGSRISESAITVLKQLEGYTTKCGGTGSIFGYGTICTDKTAGAHTTHDEEEADEVLRAELAKLDEAVNSFASNKGLSLTQGQHDALVLFSFENGTAWTTGTGDFQFAIANKKVGTEFLNAMLYWNTTRDDDNRRKIEANMYLYGKYSSVAPSYFITVEYDPNGGSINEKTVQYYDVSSGSLNIPVTPTKDNNKFLGWYNSSNVQVTSVNANAELKAKWQSTAITAENASGGAADINYTTTLSALASYDLYRIPSGKSYDIYTTESLTKQMETQKKTTLVIQKEYIDANGVKWGRIDLDGFGSSGVSNKYPRWVKLKATASSATTPVLSDGISMDVTVTVTNSYVRSRKNASIYSAQNGKYNQGAELRIINTKEADGFVWGQVAKSAEDNTAIGWVALMYTDYESVKSENSYVSGDVIATARITFNGYVNVRSDAGTDNQIVGALPYDLEVNLYETKYVNGIQWGRCNTGWFCLRYADVTRLVEDTTYTSDSGFTSYAFTGKLVDDTSVWTTHDPATREKVELKKSLKDTTVTVTNLTVNANGNLWGKIAEGWVNVDNVTLDVAKFYVVADTVTVRADASTSAQRIDTLVKGVEFNVTKIKMAEDSIWGYADKVGEGEKTYSGWVNLASKYVSRNNAPSLGTSEDETEIFTTLMGTVINTNSLKVRKTGASYGAQIGSLTGGTTVAVWEENDDGWYKVDSNKNGVYDYDGDGWVSGTYLNVYESTSSSSDSSTSTSGTVETGLGIVANTYTGVNVRQGAGTGYAAVGKLLTGTSVEILEVTTAGASKWGRTSQGWVCMDYITMVSNYEIAGSTTSSGDSSNVTDTVKVIFTGSAKADVNIRKEPSLKADIVRTLKAGENVTVHEIQTVKETTSTTSEDGTTTTTTTSTGYWARLNDGYLYNPEAHLNLDPLDEVTYTVTGYDTLNVRNGAGTSGTTIIHKLAKGDVLKVTKLQVIGNAVWGYVEVDAVDATYTTDEEGNKNVVNSAWDGEGWVNMSYLTQGVVKYEDESTSNNTTNNDTTTNNTTNNNVTLGNGSSTGGFVTNTSGYRYTGRVIRTGSLNVRATPSEVATKTTTLSSGQAMVIYETTTVNGMAWGRCDAGWVYLYYVDLTPVTGAVDARVVANENTVIYTDMNCSGVAGTYAKQSVVDIFEVVGKMARTELGWINTDNLL